jgi:hypothetical protein
VSPHRNFHGFLKGRLERIDERAAVEARGECGGIQLQHGIEISGGQITFNSRNGEFVR